ncbi:hypothetical protein K8T06_01210 [bacterium]|nr:hypothetical protein [bacterium]
MNSYYDTSKYLLCLCFLLIQLIIQVTQADTNIQPGWHWTNPWPHGYDLNDVWSIDDNDVWVGGISTLRHWDGFQWSESYIDKSQSINDLWGFDSGEIYAVGAGGLVLKWDGNCWEDIPLDTSDGLTCVHGTSPDDLWISSWNYENGTVYHWNGTEWQQETLDVMSGFSQVFAVDIDDVWLGAFNGMSFHWDGSNWTEESGGSNCVEGFLAFSSDDVWAIQSEERYQYKGPILYITYVLHWDGEDWDRVWTRNNGGLATGITGTSSDNILISTSFGTIYHWDGNTVTTVVEPDYISLNSIQMRETDDVWSVGMAGNVKHWDGFTWSLLTPGFRRDMLDLYCADATTAWAIGESYNYYDSNFYRWDGGRWEKQLSLPGTYNSVSGRSANDVWFSRGGKAVHWNGIEFKGYDLPILGRVITHVFHSGEVWFLSPSDIATWDGNEWAEIDKPYIYTYSISGPNPNNVWLAGSDSKVLHWDGMEWSVFFKDERVDFLSVWAESETNIWVVGYDYKVEDVFWHWDGHEWTEIDCNLPSFLPSSIWGTSSSNLWMSSLRQSQLIHWNGNSFTQHSLSEEVVAIHGSHANNVWAVGDAGMILHFPDSLLAETTSLELSMPSNYFTIGDSFYLDAHVGSISGEMELCDLYIALSIADQFWFYPSWSPYFPDQSADFLPLSVMDDTISVIPEFSWPYIGESMSGIQFIGLCVNSEKGILASNIDVVEFGFGSGSGKGIGVEKSVE